MKSHHPFQAVLFDCDGVLVDSEPITLKVMTEHLNRVGLKISYEETIARFLGKALPEEIPAIEAEIGHAVPQHFIEAFRADRNIALESQIVAVPGIHQLIASLQSHQLPFAVASGADRTKMGITLGKTGLLAHFEHAMVGSDSVTHTKPAPDVYLKAAHILGVDPKACLVLDDTPTGVRAGVAAGATVVGYAAFTQASQLFQAGAHAVIHSLPELTRFLGFRQKNPPETP
jgi:HAD superfamily hydrolase (TIGR01509 family)